MGGCKSQNIWRPAAFNLQLLLSGGRNIEEDGCTETEQAVKPVAREEEWESDGRAAPRRRNPIGVQIQVFVPTEKLKEHTWKY